MNIYFYIQINYNLITKIINFYIYLFAYNKKIIIKNNYKKILNALINIFNQSRWFYTDNINYTIK